MLLLAHPAWSSAHAYITNCSKPIRLREVRLKNATLDEAVAYLKAEVVKLALFDDMHLNVVVLGTPKPGARINLDLGEVTLQFAFEQVAQMAGMRLRTETHAVVLSAIPATEPIRTRIYRVPPDFISTGSAAR
ncbi:MAG: hypothetical protein ACO1TE_00235 [Prosthecobacter sp.]